MAQPIVEIRALSKQYSGGVRALEALNFEVQAGEIFGYLGPNGAGKTTTIRILLDMIRASSGEARLFGLDSRKDSLAIRARVGYLPGDLSLWKHYSGRQVIDYVGRLRGIKSTQHANIIAERLQFDASRKIREYSTGNRRKLGIVLALMHKPELLILDEPTSGLDPLVQQTFNELMRDVRNAGGTVLLSSHILGEVQAICDRVGILRGGKLQAVDSVSHLTRVNFRWVHATLQAPPDEAWLAQLRQLEGVSEVTADGVNVSVRLTGDFDALLRQFGAHYVKDLRVSQPSLEEIFLTYYGENSAARG